MDSNSNALLDLVRKEQQRRQAQAASHVVLFRFSDITDEEWAAEVEAKRRSGEIGASTVVITYPFFGTRAEGMIPKRLV